MSRQIVFVHGIMGSVLKEKQKKVWPILLTESFSSSRYDILTNLNNPDITAAEIEKLSYKKLSKFLSQNSDNYTEFVYDWRKNNLDHLEDFYSLLDDNADEIIIIAHSMGGILSKLMLNKFKDKNQVSKVSKIITIGTPWRGSIDSVKTLMFGKQIPDFIPFALLKKEAKKISKFFPSIYQLLPSDEYFQNAKDSEGNACCCFNIGGEEINDFADFYLKCIKDDFEKYKHEYIKVFDDYYELLHKDIPKWIEHHEIIGVGKNTISAMKIDNINDASAERYDGDGTVPLFSAYSKKAKQAYFVNKADHVGLTKKECVHQLIDDIINCKAVSETNEIFMSLVSPYYKKFSGKVIKIACPVEVAVLNDDGEAIYGSLDSIDEDIFQFARKNENIVYEELGSTKYVIIDEDEESYDLDELQEVDLIRIQATDTGPTSVGVDLYKNGVVKKKKSFKTFEISVEKEAVLKLDDKIESNNLEIRLNNGEIEDVKSFIIDANTELQLPQTKLKIVNNKDIILEKEALDNVHVLEDDLILALESLVRGSQDIDQTFVKNGNKLYIFNTDKNLIIPLNEGINEIRYFSKDVGGNFENETKLIVYKIPSKIYELNLEFLPHKYILGLKYNFNFENLLSNYGKLEDHKLQWEINFKEDSLDDWIFYTEKERVIEVKYKNLFNEQINDKFVVDESTIANIIEGKVEEEEFKEFLDKLNCKDAKVKMHIENSFRQRKIITDNLRNAQMLSFEEKNLNVVIKKSTKYELCWNNLTEEVDLDSVKKLKLQFSILDKDNKEVKGLNLKYLYTYKINNEMNYSDEYEVEFNEKYLLNIELENISNYSDILDCFEINVYEQETGSSIRIQKILIRK
ncbi:lipase/acyltransferase domain-containing protein [Lysinibacillus sp. NPDC094177]|uniref:lipase/acyltransferase domain-containing protein n=1 Tax=Lysinibacillus sp. NPDC094177 TaxID=3390580 RepID=UPI003D0210FB